MVPLHMGPLHPFEQALTLLLAFGPFLILGVVIAVRRRADARRDERREGRRDEPRDEQPALKTPDREGSSAR